MNISQAMYILQACGLTQAGNMHSDQFYARSHKHSWPVTRVESWPARIYGGSLRPNLRTINFYRLHSQWMDSYKRDPYHALRDAHRNLKGFTAALRVALESHQVDNAFDVAVKKVLRHA